MTTETTHTLEPVRPEDYVTAAKPIGMCRACHHHTSAFCGRCTGIVLDERGMPADCGCDCREHLNGNERTS